MATRLFVGNLPEKTSEGDLRSAFSVYGEITTLDLKTKSANSDDNKKFAFVSLAASNHGIESCIKHFANEDFNGNRLYVTRARESFLERLQREREQAQKKEADKNEPQELPKINPVLRVNEKLNPRKRKFNIQDDNIIHKSEKQEIMDTIPTRETETHMLADNNSYVFNNHKKTEKVVSPVLKQQAVNTEKPKAFNNSMHNGDGVKDNTDSVVDKKKQHSEMKRMESMKRKRQEFKVKQIIIKTGLTAVDKVQNKKVFFDMEEKPQSNDYAKPTKQTGTLFDDEDSGDEVNFAVKEQFEGKKGQKVLDLQSRYKSDKRFTLDERFIEEEQSENETDQVEQTENVELEQKDEKNKQLDILQDVLGITLKRRLPQEDFKNKPPKLGMLRFDPSQPEHARFLAPIEPKKQETRKKGKNKLKEQEKPEEPRPEEIRPEVSKEQFYKVSETLKEAIAQPNTFSLRSLFGNNETVEEESKEEQYIPLEAPKKPKVRNPLETKEKNPFVYDSSESENEDEPETKTEALPVGEPKAIWKENLFFSEADQRLKEGLAFFTISNEEAHKERRELKSLVKKRIYNKERKNQMFQKKIGGRRKIMKKNFRRKT